MKQRQAIITPQPDAGPRFDCPLCGAPTEAVMEFGCAWCASRRRLSDAFFYYPSKGPFDAFAQPADEAKKGKGRVRRLPP